MAPASSCSSGCTEEFDPANSSRPGALVGRRNSFSPPYAAIRLDSVQAFGYDPTSQWCPSTLTSESA